MDAWTDRVVPIPGEDDSLLITTDSPGRRGLGVLRRIRADGSEIWSVNAPEGGGDFFTDAVVQGEEIVAHSWSAFLVRFDLRTGTELERRFTK